MNIVTFVGRIAQDIELRKTNTGKSVTTFLLAVDRSKTEGADFFYIVAWDKLAENVANYLKKGSKVAVVGRLSTRSYEKNGDKRMLTEVIADSVEFLDPKRDDKPDAAPQDSDLPF